MSPLAPNASQTRYRLLPDMPRKISGTLDLSAVLSHRLESLRSAVAYETTSRSWS